MLPRFRPWSISLVIWLALTGAAGAAELDAQGRAFLDPIREQALRPAELIARLHLAPAARVADLGAGPGFLTLPLARAVPGGTVIATDIRGDYLEVLASRAAEAKLGNLQTRVVKPEQPGLDPKSIDVAVLCQLDHYLKDRAAYLAALVPALRPGGRIVLINYQRFRDVDVAAAKQAGLAVVDSWAPSPPFFMLVLAPAGGR